MLLELELTPSFQAGPEEFRWWFFRTLFTFKGEME